MYSFQMFGIFITRVTGAIKVRYASFNYMYLQL